MNAFLPDQTTDETGMHLHTDRGLRELAIDLGEPIGRGASDEFLRHFVCFAPQEPWNITTFVAAPMPHGLVRRLLDRLLRRNRQEPIIGIFSRRCLRDQ